MRFRHPKPTGPDRRANSIMTAWALACIVVAIVYSVVAQPGTTTDEGSDCDVIACDGR